MSLRQQIPLPSPAGRLGLVLLGGGARNAYQAGVLAAIAELLPRDAASPFPVICGTSSGAINAAMLASHALHFQAGVRHLAGVWNNLHTGKIYRTDLVTALLDSANWLLAFASGGLFGGQPQALLDNTPLRQLLESHLRLIRVQQAIDAGALRALAITACGYTSGRSICYFQADPAIRPWRRNRRLGRRSELRIDHVMASIALPLIFAPVFLHGEYHGDGSMRETAPLSPALHLGADRLLVITVRQTTPAYIPAGDAASAYPSFGQIAGYVLDTLFMDGLWADAERLMRINQLLEYRHAVPGDRRSLRPVELLILTPSRDLDALVPRHLPAMPSSVRFLLRTLGANSPGGQSLITYLMFEASYCQELLDLGYQDGYRRRHEIAAFLHL